MHPSLPDALISHLYDAAVEPHLWQGMAGRIAGAFDSTSAVLKLHGADGDVNLLQVTDNLIVPDRLLDWAHDWHRRDLWYHRSLALGLDRIATDEMLVTPEEQRRSPFYQELLASYDIFHVVGATFTLPGGAVGVLGIHRPDNTSPFGAAEQHMAAQLLPHLSRAVRLGQHLSKAGLARAAALEALDRLDTGVLVLDGTARIIHANALAEATLRGDAGLTVRLGRLVPQDVALQPRFAQAVKETLASAGGRAASVPSTLLVPRADRLPLSLSLAPLRPGWSGLMDAPPLVLAFLKDPEQSGLHVGRLRQIFGFTATEAAIAVELGAGRAPEAIAATCHIGLGTLRWHIKSILAKTGTTRQAQAVALLAHTVAALPGDHDI